MTDIDTLCESTKLRLIAAADGLMACKRTAGHIIPMQGKDCVIAIGPRDWIAKNVAGVEAMAGAELAALAQQLREIADAGESGAYMPNMAKMLRAAADEFDRLAATTQASTAQAEREILLRAALDAAEKWASTEHLHARDIGRGGRGDEKAVVRAENAARKAIIALAATSSTDAQAAAEVRDPANLPDPLPLLRRLKRELEHARRFSPNTLQTYRAACTSAEGDIEEFLLERCEAIKRAGDTGGAR